MSKTIAIVATLDTKGEYAEYLRHRIEKRGHKTIVIDPGVMGKPYMQADITREEVARRGGKSHKELVEAAEKGADRGSATEVMMKGVANVVKELYAAGKLDGIVSVGGGTGTRIGTAALSALPVGVPKLMVSTGGDIDITQMHTVADLQGGPTGFNKILTRMMSNAAGAIIGMVEAEIPKLSTKPLVGITAYGVTTPCVIAVGHLLAERGYDSVAFTVNISRLEDMIEAGEIAAIIDITPASVIENIALGSRRWDPRTSTEIGSSQLARWVYPKSLSLEA